ncbi:MAG TPA: hypothetical protein VH475_14340 [Tepidisphaeraceae bacterium]|jgi:hypothetical protein
MTRQSIFDPEGDQTEHSGTRFMGPQADNISHMPPDVVDGKVEEAEAEEHTEPDPQIQPEERNERTGP